VCAVLEYALRSRRPPADKTLIHHADHGSQYTSIKLTTRLLKAPASGPSMGTVGDSYDNALAENMWSTIKTECVRRSEFATRAEANQALFEYIDDEVSVRWVVDQDDCHLHGDLAWRRYPLSPGTT
jgi:putative transposase